MLRIHGAGLRNPLVLDELGAELSQFSREQPPSKLIVSFRNVDLATSILINALIKLRAKIIETDGSIKLCAMTTIVRESFRVLKLDGSLFSIYDTEEEAP